MNIGIAAVQKANVANGGGGSANGGAGVGSRPGGMGVGGGRYQLAPFLQPTGDSRHPQVDAANQVIGTGINAFDSVEVFGGNQGGPSGSDSLCGGSSSPVYYTAGGGAGAGERSRAIGNGRTGNGGGFTAGRTQNSASTGLIAAGLVCNSEAGRGVEIFKHFWAGGGGGAVYQGPGSGGNGGGGGGGGGATNQGLSPGKTNNVGCELSDCTTVPYDQRTGNGCKGATDKENDCFGGAGGDGTGGGGGGGAHGTGISARGGHGGTGMVVFRALK